MIQPLVSVIVATFRREYELFRALESLTNQTYENFEIIVVDDNGDLEWNTRVRTIFDKFRKKYPEIQIRLISNIANLGSSKTRNAGIDAAKGDYITFLDDDDEYLPEKIRRQVTFMIVNELDYSLTDLELFYKNGILSERRTRDYIKGTSSNMLLSYHLMHHMTGTDTLMFRKDYLEKIGGFGPADFGDEFYLMLNAIKNKGKFGHLRGCDVKAYVHTGDGGLSSGESKINGENELFEFKKQYFNQLTKKQVRYITTRHYAVIAFAEMRRKRFGAFLKSAFGAFCCSPLACIRVLKEK